MLKRRQWGSLITCTKQFSYRLEANEDGSLIEEMGSIYRENREMDDQD